MFPGTNCSIVPTCYVVSNCSGNGTCVDFDVCKCNTGWTGNNCARYSCERLNYCSGELSREIIFIVYEEMYSRLSFLPSLLLFVCPLKRSPGPMLVLMFSCPFSPPCC